MNVDQVLRRMCTALQLDSIEELAVALEKHTDTFRVWKFRNRVPPTVIAHVSERTGKPVSWLLESDESSTSLTAEEPRPSFFGAKKKQVNQPADAEEFFFVPELDVQISAGGGSHNDHQDVIGKFAFRRTWLAHKGISLENAKIVRARGDSMAERINDGDILLVDTAVTNLVRDGIYVIEQDGWDYVKLLQRDFATGGLQIISFNPKWPTQTLTAEQASELRICGRVVWHGGEL